MADAVLLNKVATIERCLERVRAEYRGDPRRLENETVLDSIVLNLQRACEASIDLAMQVAAQHRLGVPQTSREAFDLLEKGGFADAVLAERMRRMVGFRNIAGPRVLGVFACTSLSLFVAFVGTFLIYRHWLPGDGWQPLAALSGSWVGGSANMIAVKQAIGMSDAHLAMSLLTDALGYSMWVVVLFSVARLAPAFNRWTRAASSGDIPLAPAKTKAPTTYDSVLLWLGMALAVAALSGWLADWLPASGMISATTWTILLATGLGLVVGHTPLAVVARGARGFAHNHR